MEHTLTVLLANLKEACRVWFLNGQGTYVKVDEKTPTSDENIIIATVDILRHGLRCKQETAVTSNNFSPVLRSRKCSSIKATDGFKKLVDTLERICRRKNNHDSFSDDSLTKLPNLRQSFNTSSSQVAGSYENTILNFFSCWVRCELKSNCLSASLQVLVSEKELLNTYYEKYAFLQNDDYAKKLFICLKGIELNKIRLFNCWGKIRLISQTDEELYRSTLSGAMATVGSLKKHRRIPSDPWFSISEGENSNTPAIKNEETAMETKTYIAADKVSSKELLEPFRKTKSLPILQHKSSSSLDLHIDEKPTRRSKIILSASNMSSPQDILPKMVIAAPFVANDCKLENESSSIYSNSNTATNIAATGSSYPGSDCADLHLPSPSSFPQYLQQNYVSTRLNPSSSSAPSVASSNTIDSRIELINCDDIQIWTDQAYEDQKRTQPSKSQQQVAPATDPCNIPQRLDAQKHRTKNSSPIGSFLCNLFSTPPTYTHWSIANQLDGSYAETDNNAAVAVFPCNLPQHTDNSVRSSSSGGGVFESFMPVYGKKLRSRNSQSLFEDGISTLDYKTPVNKSSSKEKLESATITNGSGNDLPKYQQSLTDFLQASQMSRNNTDLEKENAHFRVSEAIISAIEHIKWDNSTDPERNWRRRKDNRSTTATTDPDLSAFAQKNNSRRQYDEQSSRNESSEHITYAELGESCLDLLSAEVVGLSLISKFNDKHLPKVSELKWLVSEEDTPQQLLPMPDNSPTANPDENVIRSLTRGTRYWAPPRQQIIFTDHPTVSRKEQIKKQNNRCAGCGMRVSRQYLNSFRYCTYLGKYHCTGCHRNQISPIPAKIIQTWDFKCYPVSVFSYRLLEQMYTYPLFYVPDLNPALYIENKTLLSARRKRINLKFVKDFVKTCRFAIREQVFFDSIPEHITSDPDIWSLSDFIDCHNKSMQRSIDQLIDSCEHHIFYCVLCTARGFRCEFCQKDQIIYPWQPKIFRCDRCGSCFHLSCWKSMCDLCCRCQRMNKREEITVA